MLSTRWSIWYPFTADPDAEYSPRGVSRRQNEFQEPGFGAFALVEDSGSRQNMPERLVYEFQMTSDFARAATDTLERALWMQNERLYHHLENRMRFRSRLPSVGMILSALGLPLALLGWTLAPRKGSFSRPCLGLLWGCC